MPRAVLDGTVLADGDRTVMVEGNHYFLPDTVQWEHLGPSHTRMLCPWKATTAYHHAVIDGETVRNMAWTTLLLLRVLLGLEPGAADLRNDPVLPDGVDQISLTRIHWRTTRADVEASVSR